MSTFHHLSDTISTWRRRRSYRAELQRLLATGDHLLRDAGLSIETAMREISKPSWRD